MNDMPETIYAGIPANGKTRSGSYSHSPIPVNQHGKPSSRKCNPRVKYIRADKYEALKQVHDRLVGLVNCLLKNEPDDIISDSGHTVLQLWRHDAEKFLNEYKTMKGKAE